MVSVHAIGFAPVVEVSPFEAVRACRPSKSKEEPIVSTPTDRGAAAPRPPATDFAALGVPEAIVCSLTGGGVTEPFPIQTATLPDSLAGRDVIGRGRTGSGKTIAFAIPLVAGLAHKSAQRQAKAPRGLVLVPTRELAAQVAETLTPLAAAMGLRVAVIHGGVPINPQVRALTNADIVVACPGRLEDLVSQRHCRLDQVRITVLDEADHMADLGFLPGVKRLLDRTPSGGQRLLFSATMDNGVDVLVKRYLQRPVSHSVDEADTPPPAMTHHVLHVHKDDKLSVVTSLASGANRTLLFTRTKHGAKKLAQQLSKHSIVSVELHGNLSQNARTRNLDMFSTGEATVLVATDIAARGIHVDDIALVVHFDPPAEHKSFLHRSGRTARAGAEGTVVTLVTPDQRREVELMTRRAGISPTATSVAPGHALLSELSGPPAPPRAPRPPRPEVAAQQQQSNRPKGGGESRGRSHGSQRGTGRSGGPASSGRSGGPASSGRPGGSSSGRPAGSGSSRPAGSGPRPAGSGSGRPRRSGGAGGAGGGSHRSRTGSAPRSSRG